MLKLFFLAVLFLFSFTVSAQSGSVTDDINEQVWKPFIKAYNDYDDDAFAAVHSKEMVRVIQDDKKIMDYDEYLGDRNKKEDDGIVKPKRTIELRFTQRINNGDNAFEIGYFKGVYTYPNGSTKKFYGKFHVLLKKENGTWKIWMDADTGKGANETVFNKADAME